MELTLELSQQKWPPEADLAQLWADNQPALVALPLAAALGGLRFVTIAQLIDAIQICMCFSLKAWNMLDR